MGLVMVEKLFKNFMKELIRFDSKFNVVEDIKLESNIFDDTHDCNRISGTFEYQNQVFGVYIIYYDDDNIYYQLSKDEVLFNCSDFTYN